RDHPALSVREQLVERGEVLVPQLREAAERVLEADDRARLDAVQPLERDLGAPLTIERAEDLPERAASEVLSHLEAPFESRAHRWTVIPRICMRCTSVVRGTPSRRATLATTPP